MLPNLAWTTILHKASLSWWYHHNHFPSNDLLKILSFLIPRPPQDRGVQIYFAGNKLPVSTTWHATLLGLLIDSVACWCFNKKLVVGVGGLLLWKEFLGLIVGFFIIGITIFLSCNVRYFLKAIAFTNFIAFKLTISCSSAASRIYERDDEVPTTTAVLSVNNSQSLPRRTRLLKGDNQIGFHADRLYWPISVDGG